MDSSQTFREQFVPGFIRTVAPLIVGFLVSFGARQGLNINDDNLAAVTVCVTSLLYWAFARSMEILKSTRWGKILLGSGKTPVYTEPPATIIDAEGTTQVNADGGIQQDGNDEGYSLVEVGLFLLLITVGVGLLIFLVDRAG